jgi:hypothetical protein
LAVWTNNCHSANTYFGHQAVVYIGTVIECTFVPVGSARTSWRYTGKGLVCGYCWRWLIMRCWTFSETQGPAANNSCVFEFTCCSIGFFNGNFSWWWLERLRSWRIYKALCLVDFEQLSFLLIKICTW